MAYPSDPCFDADSRLERGIITGLTARFCMTWAGNARDFFEPSPGQPFRVRPGVRSWENRRVDLTRLTDASHRLTSECLDQSLALFRHR